VRMRRGSSKGSRTMLMFQLLVAVQRPGLDSNRRRRLLTPSVVATVGFCGSALLCSTPMVAAW
jgi:hypothetical protein